MTHTPGPDRMISTPYGNKRASYLCRAMDIENACARANVDARLIAAVPDLLELAESIVAFDANSKHLKDAVLEWQCFARAILPKATQQEDKS